MMKIAMTSSKVSNLLKYFEDKSKEVETTVVVSPRSKLQSPRGKLKEKGSLSPRDNIKPQSSHEQMILTTVTNATTTTTITNLSSASQSKTRSTSTPTLQTLVQQARAFGNLSQVTLPQTSNNNSVVAPLKKPTQSIKAPTVVPASPIKRTTPVDKVPVKKLQSEPTQPLTETKKDTKSIKSEQTTKVEADKISVNQLPKPLTDAESKPLE
jgi:hypothetical protein